MKDKPHILICAADYFPRIGGAEVAVREITNRLADSFSFSLIAPRLDKKLKREEQIGVVQIYRVGFGGMLGKLLFPFIGTWKALHIHKKRRIGLVWGIMASWGGILAARLSTKKEIPFVLTMQEGDEEEHLMRYVKGSRFLYTLFIRPWYRFPIRHADALTVISEYLGRRARNAGYTKDPLLVPNGVDVARFRKGVSDNEKQTIRQSLNLSFGAKVLLNVSRLVEKNNVSGTLHALTHLSDDHHLVILGDGEYKEELKREAVALGIDKRVRFVGQVAHERVPAYLGIADVFVRTPHSEGFGNVFIEAMAAGVPVVASPVGGIVDFVIDPRSNVGKVAPTGVLADPDNPKDIAEAITVLLENTELREKIIADARQLVTEKYDWNRIAKLMEGVFERTKQSS